MLISGLNRLELRSNTTAFKNVPTSYSQNLWTCLVLVEQATRIASQIRGINGNLLHESDHEGIIDSIKELIFIAEIVVDQCLTTSSKLSDPVNTCPGDASLGKFVRRGLKQPFFCFLDISFHLPIIYY